MENQKKMQEQEPSSTKKRTRRTKAEIEAEKQKETVKEEAMTEEIEEGVDGYVMNLIGENKEYNFDQIKDRGVITESAYYNYKIFLCEQQVEVKGDRDKYLDIYQYYNQSQFIKSKAKGDDLNDLDSHIYVKTLKAKYKKITLVHDCMLVSEKERVKNKFK